MFIQHIIRERNPESDIPYKAPLFCNVFWHCLFWQNGIVSTRKRRGTNFEFDSDSGVGCIGNRKGKAGLRGKEYVEVCPNKKEPFRNSNSGERGIFWAKHIDFASPSTLPMGDFGSIEEHRTHIQILLHVQQIWQRQAMLSSPKKSHSIHWSV